MTFVVTESCIKCKLTDCVEVCPVDCFHEGQEQFIALNAELTKGWPVITQAKDPPDDADDWRETPDKLQYLER